MARIFEEFFEATGYDEAGWTETVPGTCVVDEDEASSAAGSPPLWGSQCLEVSVDGAGADCHTYNIFGDGAVRFAAVEFKIAALGFDVDAQQASLFYMLNAALSAPLTLIQIVRSAGVNRIRCIVYHDTTANFITDDVLTLDKLYRYEIKWDETADTWEIWVDNVSRGSGALTAAAATTQCGSVLLGDVLNSVRTFTCRYDRVEVDDANRVVGWVQTGVLSAAADAAGAFVGGSQAASIFDAGADASASFTGAPLATGVLSAGADASATFTAAPFADGVLTAPGDASAALVGKALIDGVLSGAADATANFVGASAGISNGVLAGAADATAAFTGSSLAAAVLAALGDSSAPLIGAAEVPAVWAAAADSTGAFVGQGIFPGALSCAGEGTGIFVGEALAVSVLIAMAEATCNIVSDAPIFGFGARGRVGSPSAKDHVERIGSATARDQMVRIGSALAKARAGKIGSDKA